MKALIKVGYGCNEHCTFCHTFDVRDIDGTAEEVHRKIRRARALGHTMVVLSGGEPTIRPELLAWASHTAKLGMDFGLITNGQMLSYPELVDRLVARRLRYVYLSLHGGSAAIHERLTRAEGFERTLRAIDNLSGRGLDLSLNAVVTRQNLDHLRGLVDLALGYPDVTLKFSMVQPKGGGAHNFDILTPRVSDVAARVRDAIAYGQERVGAGGPRFAHDGIPLCLLGGYEDLYDDLKTHEFATMVEIGEPDFFPVDDQAKVQPEPECAGCALRGPCPGLYRGYLDRFGAGELSAVHGQPRSNSFDYQYEAVAYRSLGEACPILSDGVSPWDRGRHLFVKDDDGISRYRSDTRDFSDREIEAIKYRLGQLYLDVSDKAAPDDFARDLRMLTRSGMCAGCPEETSCTGLFEVVDIDVFSRDDARVREHIGALAGDVLDLGCGEGRYEAELSGAADRIRYTGVDPDAAAIDRLRARWPWATLHAGAAEELHELELGTFDHVLVLRSWNHLRDPAAAVDQIALCLRPGGQLIVCDNVAFGLARSSRQTARARRSSAAFEHYRNHTAAECHAVIAPRGFELLERVDVGPTTSNQWLLRYSKSPTSSRMCP